MAQTQTSVTELLRVVDLAGVLGNAILGGVMARTARLDLVGFVVLAIMSGLGGGMIRDTLLQQGPPIALTDYAYVLSALVGAVLAFHFTFEGVHWNRWFPVIDAAALGCWASAGALKTLDSGLGWLPAVMLGTVTAVGGGFLRDITLRQVPSVLGESPLYATCAAVAAGVLVIFVELDLPTVGVVAATGVGMTLCLVARWRRWMLPLDADWGLLRREGERRRRSIERLRSRHRREDEQ